MAVRIRLKRMGRTHRPFYRVCAIDGRKPRDGRVIEELGHYDPMIRNTDARAILNGDRIDYWLGVGAQPSDRVRVLIRKYGTNGSHLEAQRDALERIQVRPQSPIPVPVALPAKGEAPRAAEVAAEEAVPAKTAAGEVAAGEVASGEVASGDQIAGDDGAQVKASPEAGDE